jgi:nitrate reductase NapE component
MKLAIAFILVAVTIFPALAVIRSRLRSRRP